MNLQAWRGFWAKLDWVEELSYLAILGADACLIYPWQALLFSWLGRDGIPWWALAVLIWATYAMASILAASKMTPDRRQALTAALLVVSVLVYIRLFLYVDYGFGQVAWVGEMANRLFSFDAFPPDLVAVLVGFAAWWRGLVAARKEYDTPSTWFHFRVGIVLMFAYFFLTIFGERTDATPALLGFFFFGLVSIAMARILELGGIHSSTLGSRRWLAVLAGATGGSLALGLLITVLFSRETLRLVLGWFHPLGRLLGHVAWYLVSFILYLAFPLFEWLFELVRRLRESGSGFGLSPLGSMLVSPPFGVDEREPAAIYPICRTAIIVVIVVGGLLLITRLIRKLVREQAERSDIERESILSTENVLADLRAGLEERLRRLRALADRFGGQHRRSIASIRKIYASMVDLATEAGYPRRAAETPYEYRGTLYQAFPACERAVDTITEAYVRTHYGEVPDTPEKMAQIVSDWQTLQEHITPWAERT